MASESYIGGESYPPDWSVCQDRRGPVTEARLGSSKGSNY
jgi:hypothetical protein